MRAAKTNCKYILPSGSRMPGKKRAVTTVHGIGRMYEGLPCLRVNSKATTFRNRSPGTESWVMEFLHEPMTDLPAHGKTMWSKTFNAFKCKKSVLKEFSVWHTMLKMMKNTCRELNSTSGILTAPQSHERRHYTTRRLRKLNGALHPVLEDC